MPHFIGRKVVKRPVALTAAEYLRASTDRQKHSIEHQRHAIAKYASDNDITIVCSYTDPGRSGVTMRHRPGLKQLIADVHHPNRNFNTILVYDVSRWGRFQDIDESAHYEFLCRANGVSIRYCAEPFVNDGAFVNSIMKSMKRAIAGEYSRDLSSRTSHAQRRYAARGFHQGGAANFGLRRIVINERGERLKELKLGEHKLSDTDKVILVPGPKYETDVVREVFNLFAIDRLPKKRIARLLNKRGFRNSHGSPWTGHTVNVLLHCERYLGRLVYNRTSLKLGRDRVKNPPEDWICVERAFPPIVDPELFRTAQLALNDTWALSNNDMLDYLTAALCVHGFLSSKLLNRIPIVPATNTFCDHFGSLPNAYRLIGYKPAHKYRYRGLSDVLRSLDREITGKLISSIERSSGRVALEHDTHVLRINNQVTVALVIVPYFKKTEQIVGWRLFLKQVKPCDIVLMARLDFDNRSVFDYHLFPRSIFLQPSFGFTEGNIGRFSIYKLGSLEEFYRSLIQKIQNIQYLLSRPPDFDLFRI